MNAARWPTRALGAMIRGGRLLLTPLTGPCCRFHPTCSDYAVQALAVHGAWKGCWLALWRLLRCHPFSAGGYDPVPPLANAACYNETRLKGDDGSNE